MRRGEKRRDDTSVKIDNVRSLLCLDVGAREKQCRIRWVQAHAVDRFRKVQRQIRPHFIAYTALHVPHQKLWDGFGQAFFFYTVQAILLSTGGAERRDLVVGPMEKRNTRHEILR